MRLFGKKRRDVGSKAIKFVEDEGNLLEEKYHFVLKLDSAARLEEEGRGKGSGKRTCRP